MELQNSRRCLLSAVVLLLTAVACVPENFGSLASGEISFSASTSYVTDADETKTVYSGERGGTPTFSQSQVYRERVDWVAGKDAIRIICNEALPPQNTTASDQQDANGNLYSDYLVMKANKAEATLISPMTSAAGSPNGLQWGTGDHYFYALYPSPRNTTPSDSVQVLKMQVNASTHVATISGYIPPTQKPAIDSTYTKGGVKYREFLPNMNFAAMAAFYKGSASGNKVELKFRPLVTTLRFELLAADDAMASVVLEKVRLQSNKPVAGNYKAEIGGTANNAASQVPKNGAVNGGIANYVDIQLPAGTKLSRDVVTAVTFLCAPFELTDLKLELSFTGGATRTLRLTYKDGSTYKPVVVRAFEKSYFDGMKVNVTNFNAGTEPYDPGTGPFVENNFSVSYNGVPTLSTGTAAYGGTITLDDERAVTMNFLVNTNLGYKVSVSSSTYYSGTLPSATGSVVNASASLNILEHLSYGTLPASQFKEERFTVGDGGRKVYFSSGNLQYRASGGGSWRFAQHQFDYVGDAKYGTVSSGDNTKISATYNGWIDLFGWGTSGYTAWATGSYGSARVPWSTSTTNSDYGPTTSGVGLTGSFANGDWGVHNSTALGDTYRTLTNAEWNYLLHTRSGYRYLKTRLRFGPFRTFTVTFTAQKDASYSVSYTVVQPTKPIYGLIIFPDDIQLHATEIASYLADIHQNKWTEVGNWPTLERFGCVFLPVAGKREGVSLVNVNEAFYWGSTHSTSQVSAADGLYFSNSKLPEIGSHNRSEGLSVRLVRDDTTTPVGGTEGYSQGGSGGF